MTNGRINANINLFCSVERLLEVLAQEFIEALASCRCFSTEYDDIKSDFAIICLLNAANKIFISIQTKDLTK